MTGGRLPGCWDGGYDTLCGCGCGCGCDQG